MSNITPYINAIQNARYGEEVRGSIVNALVAINTQTEEAYDEMSAQIFSFTDANHDGNIVISRPVSGN